MHLKCVFYYIFLSVYETDFLTQLKIGNYVSGFISTIKYRLKEKTVSFTSPPFGECRKSREKKLAHFGKYDKLQLHSFIKVEGLDDGQEVEFHAE